MLFLMLWIPDSPKWNRWTSWPQSPTPGCVSGLQFDMNVLFSHIIKWEKIWIFIIVITLLLELINFKTSGSSPMASNDLSVEIHVQNNDMDIFVHFYRICSNLRKISSNLFFQKTFLWSTRLFVHWCFCLLSPSMVSLRSALSQHHQQSKLTKISASTPAS